MSKWLVTGARGMLAAELLGRLQAARVEVMALTHADLDITDAVGVDAALAGHDVVVNLAAWTDVDGAEDAEDAAYRVNAVGPATLARACVSSGAQLVQLSTDYVFDGTALQPYQEDAATNPINAYGRTKRAGEVAVLDLLPDATYVLRTSWLYGAHGRNFVSTMARLSQEREHLDVVMDQRGQPTWAGDVASRIVELVASDAPAGIYHATSSGETTWFGLARAVFEELGLDPQRIRPITSDGFIRPAARPAYSVLGHGRWALTGLPPMRDWRAALAAAVPSMFGSTHARE
jgi:dTDP-4-dehydrorhamnose reductase